MKTLVTALVLSFAPALAFAACGHESAAMSCASGMVYDTDSRSCIPTTG
jgi:hypothetical protein